MQSTYNSFNELAGVGDAGTSNMSMFDASRVSVDTPPSIWGRRFSSFNELATENGFFDKWNGKTEPKWVYPMKQVDSSYLAKVGYDGNRRVMTVMFWDGSVFEYSNVAEPEYKELLDAQSHGQWFYRNVRTNKPWKQVSTRKTTQKPGFATRTKSVSSEWTGSSW